MHESQNPIIWLPKHPNLDARLRDADDKARTKLFAATQTGQPALRYRAA
jgi:hypothetical protein